MNQPKVLFDARSASTRRITGWERYTRNLLSIVSTNPNVSISASSAGGIIPRISSDWIALPYLSRAHDIVHYPSIPPSPLVPGKKTIVTIHDLTWWKYPETASFLGKNYYRQMAEIATKKGILATVSQSMAAEMREHFPNAAVHVISNVVTIDEIGTVPSRTPEKPYFLAVGSIEPRKNLARLAQAFQISGLATDFDLVLVGRQAWGDLPQGVKAVGAVSDGELKGFYEKSQALFVPSLYEGFGLPVGEALALGTPVYCSDLEVFREVAGSNANYFDPLDVDSIVSSLIKAALLKPSDRLAPHNPFSRETVASQLSEVYLRASE